MTTLLGDKATPSLISELLYRMKVRDVMSTNLAVAAPEDSLRSIQATMKARRITGVPVVANKRAVGIVSMDDIINALDQGHINEPAELHMTRQLLVLEDDMPLSMALSYMEKHHFGRFPVLDKTGVLVGIITSRDIIMHLLVAMNSEVETMEERLRPAEQAGGQPTAEAEFHSRKFDFENAGKASSEIKRLCKEAGLDTKLIRRIAIASYELEMNQVIHSVGGTMKFRLAGGKATVTAADNGPGIPDVEKALSEGWSTATEWVRSLGFGAGMGLPNSKRVSDGFRIASTMGEGTTVVCTFDLDATTVRPEAAVGSDH
jgi:CBS domain-containing protein/anti-sigma regulatory factor (Ser/Thr protein kinase)